MVPTYTNDGKPGVPIIDRTPGPGTGETILVDAMGRRWLEVPRLPSKPSTGQHLSWNDGERIYDLE